MDQIANLITAIRNAELASHTSLTVRHSKQNLAVLNVLKETGFVATYSETKTGVHPAIAIELPQPVTRHHYKRISKPGRRLYTSAQEIPTVLRGLGIVVLSTPKGIMTGQAAKKAKVGGEVMFEAY